MSNEFSYWTKLSESSEPQWVHALPVGSFNHPRHGTVTITADRIKRFAQNIKQRVRGIDPYINYDHRETSGEAAGWVKDAEQRENGLWLFVEWTKDAAEKISSRKYRYFSAEYADEWEDPHSGNKYEDVVIGGALTNLPFLKNLVPINLSEISGGETVDRAELAKLLGLPETATEEDIKNKLAELNKSSEPEAVDLSKATITVGEDGTIKVTHPDLEGEVTHKVELPKATEKEETEEEKELAKLAESNPVVKKLMEDVAELQTANRLNEVSIQLSELGSADNKGLPPVAAEKFRNLMARLPKQFSEEIYSALTELFKVGIVELGEKSAKSKNGKQPEGDPVKKFMDVVDELRTKDDKLTYRDAVAQARRENPELYHQYNEAVEAGNVALAE